MITSRSARSGLRSAFLAVVLAIIQAACGGASSGGNNTNPTNPNPAPTPTPTPNPEPTVPTVAHVFVLINENHSYGDVIGNSNMPYTNSLAQQYSLATQYYANTHPSLPNYFMLTTGSLVTDTDAFTGAVTSDNVARAVTAAGKTWKIYAESLPSVGYLGPSVVPYDRNHNPFSYFSDLQTSPSQAANVVPFTQLATDLQNGTLPDYAMLVPDMSDDGHDCPNEAAQCTNAERLAHVDAWVQSNIGPVISNSAFSNSVLIYTWDEAEESDTANGGGHVATILVGPMVKHGYQSTTLYQHPSTLRLTMELLGITDLPGDAAGAPDMAEFF